ncbi:MAG TPA: amidase family protein, partial [Candidatus Limnocylindrales bacterium]|nr:amidase family protein [Candidatus Limnocylindrales bacterium]
LFEIAESTGGRADPACQAARATATSIARAAIDDLMAELDLDAIVAPTNGAAWVTDPVNGDLGGDFSTFVGSSSPSAIAGYANVTVPMGYAYGVLPLGISFIGGQWDEPALIGFAYDFEQATEVRVPPSFIPSLE